MAELPFQVKESNTHTQIVSWIEITCVLFLTYYPGLKQKMVELPTVYIHRNRILAGVRTIQIQTCQMQIGLIQIKQKCSTSSRKYRSIQYSKTCLVKSNPTCSKFILGQTRVVRLLQVNNNCKTLSKYCP